MVAFYTGAINADSRNTVFVAPAVGDDGVKVFSIRVFLFKPSDSRSLSPIGFFFLKYGREFLAQLSDSKNFSVGQTPTFADGI